MIAKARQSSASRTPGRIARPWSGATWAFIAILFVIGLSSRFVGLEVPRRIGPNEFVDISRWRPDDSVARLEPDERIYIALVEQLDAGRGYTLKGHPILNDPTIVGPQYGRALFFHPPGGIVLFWLMHQLVGESGFALAETQNSVLFSKPINLYVVP